MLTNYIIKPMEKRFLNNLKNNKLWTKSLNNQLSIINGSNKILKTNLNPKVSLFHDLNLIKDNKK